METRNSIGASKRNELEPSTPTRNAPDTPAQNASGTLTQNALEKPTANDAGKAKAIRVIAFAAAAAFAISLAFLGCSLANSEPTSTDQACLLGAALPDDMSGAPESGVECGSADAANAFPYGAPSYGMPESEEYAFVEEPGFMSTASNPLSTLSADVDTASYCNLRRMVSDGVTAGEIPAGAIRTEEILNYFDYDYAPPASGDLLGLTARAGTCPWNPETILLVLGFSTDERDAVDPDGSNLVFLIDTSGSMRDPDKLPLIKDSFAALVEQLDERDRISIVTYSESESVLLEGASGSDKARIMRAVNSLEAGGSTNGGAGLASAYDIARRNFVEDGVNRIVIASDGDLNVGMTSESELHDFVARQREGGIYLSVLGFGSGNYKDTKMEVIADYGNGAYHYIDRIEEAQRVFGEDLRSNFVPLADDVKVQVEFNPAQIKGYRLIGYENRTLAAEEFKNDAVDAGEVGAGHQFTVAYEVVPVGSSFEIDAPTLKYRNQGDENGAADGSDRRSWRDTAGSEANAKEDNELEAPTDSAKTPPAEAAKPCSPDAVSCEWLTCSIRYKPAGSETCVEQQAVVDGSAFSINPGCDWEFAAAIIECSMLLRQSAYAGTATYSEALELINPVDEDREEFAEIVRRLYPLYL